MTDANRNVTYLPTPFCDKRIGDLYGILKNYRYCIDASHFININLLLINVKFTKKLVWKHFDRAFMKL